MARQTRRIPLSGSAPGTRRELLFFDYGNRAARPRAYIQASIHADEVPAMLVQHHLARLLDAAEAGGQIKGSITLAPYANPLGLDQWRSGYHQGRYEERAQGGNFNRNWPRLAEAVAPLLQNRLGSDAEANKAAIREAMAAALEEGAARGELDAQRRALAAEAVDSDILLDLHCDTEALLHLYLLACHWPEGEDLTRELGCEAVLLSDDSGGDCFDESFAMPWLQLAEMFPGAAIPPACFAVTVELRGQADVSDHQAAADARAIFHFLQRRGVIDGNPGPLPEPLCEATRLEACDVVLAPASGIISYRHELGDEVRKGDVLADLIDPGNEDPEASRQYLIARTSGKLLTRQLHKYVQAGLSIAKVVGNEPLPHRRPGALMED